MAKFRRVRPNRVCQGLSMADGTFSRSYRTAGWNRRYGAVASLMVRFGLRKQAVAAIVENEGLYHFGFWLRTTLGSDLPENSDTVPHYPTLAASAVTKADIQRVFVTRIARGVSKIVFLEPEMSPLRNAAETKPYWIAGATGLPCLIPHAISLCP